MALKFLASQIQFKIRKEKKNKPQRFNPFKIVFKTLVSAFVS